MKINRLLIIALSAALASACAPGTDDSPEKTPNPQRPEIRQKADTVQDSSAVQPADTGLSSAAAVSPLPAGTTVQTTVETSTGTAATKAPPLGQTLAAGHNIGELDLKNPASLNLEAPSVYKVRLDTTQGDAIIEIHKNWSANGANRFYNLVKAGYFTDVAFYRVLPGRMAQFGIHGDPALSSVWAKAFIPDDKVVASNTRSTVAFAASGKDTRTTQLFINYTDNSFLDKQGVTPIGRVVSGMISIDTLYSKYGEGAPKGNGPMQKYIYRLGNEFLKDCYPKMDYIKSAEIVE